MGKVQTLEIREPRQLDHLDVVDPGAAEVHRHNPPRRIALHLAAQSRDPAGVDGEQGRDEAGEDQYPHSFTAPE
jgi:hypothetical protein